MYSNPPQSCKAIDVKDKSVRGRAGYIYIKQRLKNNYGESKFSFIGYEGIEFGLVNNYPLYQYYKHNLLLQFYGRNSSKSLRLTEDQFKKSLLSSMNANVYVYMENPDLMNSIPLYGVEDQELGDFEEKYQPLVSFNSTFNSIKVSDQKYWESKTLDFKKEFAKNPFNISFFLKLVFFKHNIISMNIDSLSELENQIQEFKSSSVNFPWIQSELESLFEAARMRIKLNLSRNSSSSIALARLNSSGIHFVGLNHYRDIVKNLEKICAKESVLGQEQSYQPDHTSKKNELLQTVK